MTSADVIQRGAAAVDQESVAFGRNWLRGTAALARGEAEESGGGGGMTIWSTEHGRRRPWSGGRRWRSEEAQHREDGRGRRRWGAPRAHPGHAGVVGGG